ncbi:helix-turn-helix domain-containing protein [Tranquillimonas rosea]|uniref:helix-turn-helix domain-containing protein n=1 Tax=Tranquillimonas rosea TaxID=641238 RepID=UPI003BABCE0D
MTSQENAIAALGGRLRAYRLGKGLTPDEIARRTGISRAAIYRYEAGQPMRVDSLGKIAELLGVSLTSLLGVGSEYFSSAVSFFERMRQLEAEADHITVLFGPVSYLLTTDAFDAVLPDVLRESVPSEVADPERDTAHGTRVTEILRSRKETYRQRRPNIVSLVSAGELEQFLREGFVGAHLPDETTRAERRAVARSEVENIATLLADPPMGVQIGVIIDALPGSSFQVIGQGPSAQVLVSPFRLGTFANTRIGVATVTAAQESVDLHQSVARDLWRRSLKGQPAADLLGELLAKYS